MDIILVATLFYFGNIVLTDEYLVNAQSSCAAEYSNYARATEYETSRFKQTPASDPSCEPLGLWTLQRHGSRYTKRKNVQERILKRVRLDILNNANKGFLCQETLDNLTYWTMRMEEKDDWKLAGTGWTELIGIGSRLKERYPSLFERYDRNRYTFRHSNLTGLADATKDAAKAWTQGVFGSYDGVELVEDKAYYTNFGFAEACENYKQAVANTDPKEKQNFLSGSVFNEALNITSRLTGVPHDYYRYDDRIHQVYDVCRYEKGIYGESPWCGILEPFVLRALEFEEDLYWYWSMSYPNPMYYKRSCKLMTDAMNHLRNLGEEENGIKVVGNFGHVPHITTFHTLIGLYKDDKHITADGFESQKNRKFRISKQGSMGANFVLVLNNCSSVGYVVEAFVDEEPIKIPGCSNKKCPYEELLALWQPLVDSCIPEDICSSGGIVTDSTPVTLSNYNLLSPSTTSVICICLLAHLFLSMFMFSKG